MRRVLYGGSSSDGGSGAPTDASYVTLAANAALSAEAVLGAAVIMRGTLAARPAAGVAGRLYVTTDDDQAVYRDNATSWDLAAVNGITVEDDGTVEGAGIRTLNFGSGVDVAVVGTEATVTASGGGGLTVANGHKAADQSVTNSTTLVDCTDMAFAVGASEVWTFRMLVWYDATTTGDLQVSIAGPAGATGTWQGTGLQNLATTVTDTVRFSANDIGGTRGFGGVAVGTKQYLLINGIIVNGATAGTCKLQFAQNTLDAANATRVYANSFYSAVRL